MKTENQEVQIMTVKLKIFMHCQGCVRDIEKLIYGMRGVLAVEADMQNGTVTVKGAINPNHLVERIKKKLGKHAEIELEQVVEKVEEKAAEEVEEKAAEEVEESSPEAVTVYKCPPQYMRNHPCEMFSDENSQSCSIM